MQSAGEVDTASCIVPGSVKRKEAIVMERCVSHCECLKSIFVLGMVVRSGGVSGGGGTLLTLLQSLECLFVTVCAENLLEGKEGKNRSEKSTITEQDCWNSGRFLR